MTRRDYTKLIVHGLINYSHSLNNYFFRECQAAKGKDIDENEFFQGLQAIIDTYSEGDLIDPNEDLPEENINENFITEEDIEYSKTPEYENKIKTFWKYRISESEEDAEYIFTLPPEQRKNIKEAIKEARRRILKPLQVEKILNNNGNSSALKDGKLTFKEYVLLHYYWSKHSKDSSLEINETTYRRWAKKYDISDKSLNKAINDLLEMEYQNTGQHWSVRAFAGYYKNIFKVLKEVCPAAATEVQNKLRQLKERHPQYFAT